MVAARFDFATATRIVFGRGASKGLGAEAAKLGRHALVVGGQPREMLAPVLAALDQEGMNTTWFGVTGEPETATVEEGVALARRSQSDLIIGIGGGSAIDTAKAIAAMLGNPGELLDYLEVIGHGKALPNKSLPFIAVPTTSGTGAEVTRNAVLASKAHKVKVSLRSPGMLASLALVDPELTANLPPAITASTGMDALTQVIEPLVSCKSNPMIDGICREGITRCSRSLLNAFRNGDDMDAREDMSLASLFGGLALANAGLGAVHGFAGPLGGMFPAPHGAVCAALLPHVMSANIAALQKRDPESDRLRRFDEVARLLTGNATATAVEGVRWVSQLVADLSIPGLRAYGITENHIPEIVSQSKRASSMKGNPLTLDDSELAEILRFAL